MRIAQKNNRTCSFIDKILEKNMKGKESNIIFSFENCELRPLCTEKLMDLNSNFISVVSYSLGRVTKFHLALLSSTLK